jgi:HlyD family secretion protein
MKRALIVLVVLAAAGAGGWMYYVRSNAQELAVNTSPVTRGDIIESVGSTGTVQAVTTVQVGSQVSGNILWLGADFNSIVKKNQVIAKLDPSLTQAQLDSSNANLAQARASLAKAQSDLERMKVLLTDAQQKYTRAKELTDKGLTTQSDLETAKTNLDSAQASLASQAAGVKQSEAAVVQSEATVNTQKVNLEHTIITAPIDGIVTQRSVDVGQTVNAGLSAPTLFVLAADLTKMQVNANIDESDVGKIRPGQRVTFRVDAYPTDTFEGTVTQVRLQPVVQSNVTTYGTIINVPNPELKLKPGMTANLKVEVHKRTDVLRVPAAALRFRPTVEMFAALNEPVPPEAVAGGRARGGQGGGGRNAGGGQGGAQQGGGQAGGRNGGGAFGGRAAGGGGANQAAPAATAQPGMATRDGSAQPDQNAGTQAGGRGDNAAGGGNAGGGNTNRRAQAGGDGATGRGNFAGRGGQGGFGGGRTGSGTQGGRGQGQGQQAQMDRFNAMSVDEQQQFIARLKGRGADVSAYEKAAKAQAPAASFAAKYGEVSGSTIDALFAPLPPIVETAGRAWIFVDKQLKPVNLRLGLSDGTNTELVSGDVEQGAELVTSVTGLGPSRPVAGGNNPNANPLLGNQRGPGGPPPGGFGGAPGGGGRGR